MMVTIAGLNAVIDKDLKNKKQSVSISDMKRLGFEGSGMLMLTPQ